MSYLEGTDNSSLLTLSKDSTTRKYGELASLTVPELELILRTYL